MMIIMVATARSSPNSFEDTYHFRYLVSFATPPHNHRPASFVIALSPNHLSFPFVLWLVVVFFVILPLVGEKPSSTMSTNPRFSMFLRAIGLKPGFRRTGPSSLFSIGVAALVGVVSGHYIFHEPLQAYWKEQQQLQMPMQSEKSDGPKKKE